jgi:hypothetical protein
MTSLVLNKIWVCKDIIKRNRPSPKSNIILGTIQKLLTISLHSLLKPPSNLWNFVIFHLGEIIS